MRDINVTGTDTVYWRNVPSASSIEVSAINAAERLC